MNAAAVLHWDKPGPGAWVFDGAHSTGPATPVIQQVFPTAMADGFRSFTARYGLPISHIDVRYVNDFPYGAVRVAGVAPSDRPPPPAWLLRALTRLHPELRRRNRNARRALDSRVWHEDLRRWFEELRPARVASLRALQSVDPELLDDDGLAAHLDACVAALADGLREHFSLLGASTVPIGLHIVREAGRGRSAREALEDLGGAAAGSTAATLPALRAVAEALADVGVDATTLDDVRAASPAAARALDAYLAEYGQRVVGAFDVTGRRLVEMPDVILRSIAAARAHSAPVDAPHVAGDPVVDDARLALSSRDDHAGVSCTWPVGLARRALQCAGSRLHAAGLLAEPDHVLGCAPAEVTGMLRRDPDAPSADELAARAAERMRRATIRPVPVLGTPHAPPDPALFPAGLRRISGAMGAFLAAADAKDRRGDSPGVGVGVGDAPYRGRAVVALDPEDAIDRLGPGDVLVTTTTTPAFNCVLPIAGALVTAHGGLMSHAGIAARELGIPAVLGVPDALERLPDGAEVEVDPLTATVRVIG